jgi:hypothetical protein
MATDSSKIKKDIKSIIFISEKMTEINFSSNFTPHNHNQAVKENPRLRSNMARHDDLKDAMDKFKVHLMVRSELMDPTDRLGMTIEKSYFDDHIYRDDPRLDGVHVTGVIITTKEDTTGFQIIGHKLTKDGKKVDLKSPAISTIALADGENVYNYPLRVFADEHKETLLLEAREFLLYKSNAMTLFNSATVTQLTPKQKAAAEKQDVAV